MSLILDALNRSRDEPPPAGQAPGLDAQHYTAPRRDTVSARGVLLPMLAGAALVLLAWGLWYDLAPPVSDSRQSARVSAPQSAPTPTVESASGAAPARPERVTLSASAAPGQLDARQMAEIYGAASSDPEQETPTESSPSVAVQTEPVSTDLDEAAQPVSSPPVEEAVDLQKLVKLAATVQLLYNNTIVSYNGLFITIYVVHHDIGKITKA